MVLIHEKITALLGQRHLKKRDLARALDVSPQTATDICKGRSAITLPHLRNLVRFFELRPDFWLDDNKLLPDDSDQLKPGAAAPVAQAGNGASPAVDVDRLLARVRAFVVEHRASFLARHHDLTADEKRLLGLADSKEGVVGRIVGAAE